MAPIPSPLCITNLENGETVHQRCLLVTGTYALDAAEGSYIHVTTKGANRAEIFPEQTWPLAGGNFKALVMLSPGLNILEFAYVCNDCIEHTIEINVNHWPLLQYPPLHLAIMVASDSPCLIDCPPRKAAGISSTHSDLDAAIAKLRMTAYMWQAMTAEDLRRKGLGRRSFRLDEEWTADTVSREFTNARIGQTLAQDGAMRSTAKIHLVRSSKTVKQIRDEDVAQQNENGKKTSTLFDYFKAALKTAGGPFASDARPIVAGLILDSHYSISKDMILGHAALGGHDPKGISLGMFGSHLTYSWPRFLEEVTSCLTDTREPGDKVGNDNRECSTMWEACAIGQGAHLHEVGHAFGSPHQSIGIMERGYARDWAKNFLSKTAYSGFLRREGVLVSTDYRDNNARWDLPEALLFRMHPHFYLPTDPILTDAERKAKPDLSVSHDNEKGPAILQISSSSGIARITFNFDKHQEPAEWIQDPPKTLQFTEDELAKRFNRTQPLHARILAFNGQKTNCRNIWQLFSVQNFISIPGSSIRLRKRLAYSDANKNNYDESKYYEWAQLLYEKGKDGRLQRAVSIDLRVGCLWDGGVVKYGDGHVSHWGPMRRNGQKHRFGGHASEKISLPLNVEITSVQVNPGDGVRVHLSNGKSAGELNLRDDEDENRVVEVKPADDEVVVGFFGKSHRYSCFCGVCEFGLICVKKDIGLDGLPDATFDMDELKNTAGMIDEDDCTEDEENSGSDSNFDPDSDEDMDED